MSEYGSHKYDSDFLNRIVKWNKKVPFIFVTFVISCIITTCYNDFEKIFHNHNVEHLVEFSLWLFFAFLGTEINVLKVISQGKSLLLTLIGGIFGPFCLVYLLTQNFYLALAATATDVAFSQSSLKILDEKKFLGVFAFLTTLAIADDLSGIGAMGYFFAKDSGGIWLLVEFAFLAFTAWVARTEKIESTAIWWVFAIINTYILHMAHVHIVIGACLVFIILPEKTEKKLYIQLRVIVPFALGIFGLKAGSINLGSTEAWGMYTLLCCLGGFGGKYFGVFITGMLARFTQPKEERFTPLHVNYLSLGMACNGTVAMIFVFAAHEAGKISALISKQSALGFMLTIPLVVCIILITKNWANKNAPDLL